MGATEELMPFWKKWWKSLLVGTIQRSQAFWMIALLDDEQPNVNPNEHGVFSSQTLDIWHRRLSLFKLGLFSVCCPDFCIVRTMRCQIHSCHSTKDFNHSLLRESLDPSIWPCWLPPFNDSSLLPQASQSSLVFLTSFKIPSYYFSAMGDNYSSNTNLSRGIVFSTSWWMASIPLVLSP